MRISNFAPKKPSNVRICLVDILTFDGLASSLELQAGRSRIGETSSSPPSSATESTKRLEHQILKLNGFSKPYCQFKWIFPSIMAPIKSLILFKMNSHAKMAPDSRARHQRSRRTKPGGRTRPARGDRAGALSSLGNLVSRARVAQRRSGFALELPARPRSAVAAMRLRGDPSLARKPWWRQPDRPSLAPAPGACMRRRLLPQCERLQPKRAAAALKPRLCYA